MGESSVSGLWRVVAGFGRGRRSGNWLSGLWWVVVPQLKLLELVASCGELWRVVAGCGELWRVVVCVNQRGSRRDRESVPASHKANPSGANPESKRLVPLCIATKASHNSTNLRAQIRPHRQAELSAYLVLAGSRSQQATTRAKSKKRPRDRLKYLIPPAPANVATFADRESTP